MSIIANTYRIEDAGTATEWQHVWWGPQKYTVRHRDQKYRHLTWTLDANTDMTVGDSVTQGDPLYECQLSRTLPLGGDFWRHEETWVRKNEADWSAWTTITLTEPT